jgi:hypothetical protein
MCAPSHFTQDEGAPRRHARANLIVAYLTLVGLFADDRLRTHLRIGRLETDAAAARRLSSADSEPTFDIDGALWEALQSQHGVWLDEPKAQVQADLASAAETTHAYIDARLDEDSRRRAQGAEPEPDRARATSGRERQDHQAGSRALRRAGRYHQRRALRLRAVRQ